MSYTKNEIIELNRDLTVGKSAFSDGTQYTKGTLFVVEKVTAQKLNLVMLDSKGCIDTNERIEGKVSSILKITKSTQKKFKHTAIKLKKGQLFVFNKDETFDFESNEKVTVLKGTRVIILKGGVKPVIGIDQLYKGMTMLAITYPLSDFGNMFTEVEPIVDELLTDWSVKNLRTLEGHRGYHVTATICFKSEPVVEYEVEHIGCDPQLKIKSTISKEAKESLNNVLNKIIELEAKYDKEPQEYKNNKDYALETLGNFLTSQVYKLRTIERDIQLSD